MPIFVLEWEREEIGGIKIRIGSMIFHPSLPLPDPFPNLFHRRFPYLDISLSVKLRP
jgi:hypothetical protein